MGSLGNREGWGGGQGVDENPRTLMCRLVIPSLRSFSRPGHTGPCMATGSARWVSLVPSWVSQGWGPAGGPVPGSA